MMQDKKIALLAFEGSLPQAVIHQLQKQNISFLSIGFKEFPCNIKNNELISLGQIGRLFSIFKKNNITHIACAGYIRRPYLWSLRCDWTGLKTLFKLFPFFKKGDDTLLKKVMHIIETEGFKMISLKDFCPELLIPKGCLTAIHPSDTQKSSIQYGENILSLLSQADMGQSIAVCGEVILAAEALEGTDAMIRRCCDIPASKRNNLPAPILIKTAKNNQTSYADLPVIGMDTLKNLKEASFTGVGFQAGSVLFVSPQEMIHYANKNNIFIYGF